MKIKFSPHIRRFSPDELCLGGSIVIDTTDLGDGYIGGITFYLELILWQLSLDFSCYKKLA